MGMIHSASDHRISHQGFQFGVAMHPKMSLGFDTLWVSCCYINFLIVQLITVVPSFVLGWCNDLIHTPYWDPLLLVRYFGAHGLQFIHFGWVSVDMIILIGLAHFVFFLGPMRLFMNTCFYEGVYSSTHFTAIFTNLQFNTLRLVKH